MKKHLSLFNCFQLSFHSFFKNFKKTISTSSLLACSLLFLGVSLSVCFFDEIHSKAQSMVKYDSYTILSSKEGFITEDDLLKIEKLTEKQFAAVTPFAPLWEWEQFFPLPEEITLEELKEYPVSPPTAICYLPNTLQHLVLSGRLPSKKNEVAINDCMLRLFLSFGYVDFSTNEIQKFSTAEEFLSASPTLYAIDPLTLLSFPVQIVGVVSVPCDTSNHQVEQKEMGMNDKVFVSKEYASSVMKEIFSLDAIGIYAIGERCSFQEAQRLLSQTEYRLQSKSISSVDSIQETLEKVAIIFFILSGIFFSFSALLLVQFINLSLERRRQEIGILRVLGARKKDIQRVFSLESVSIATLSALTAIPLLILALKGLNTFLADKLMLSIVFLTFSPWIPLIILLTSIFVSLLATFVPIQRRVNGSPIDSLYKNTQ